MRFAVLLLLLAFGCSAAPQSSPSSSSTTRRRVSSGNGATTTTTRRRVSSSNGRSSAALIDGQSLRGGVAADGRVEIRVNRLSASRVLRASVALVGASGSGVKGWVVMEQNYPDTMVRISGTVMGLAGGKHGFHVHAEGALGNNCKDAKGHFNPFAATHGAPDSSERHVGDLGNIEAPEDDSRTEIEMYDDRISLNVDSASSIIGRAIVIHAGQDDVGLGGDEGSLKTGNAGARVACGIIRPEAPPEKCVVVQI